MILYRKKFAGPLLIGAAVGTALALAPAAHAEPPYAEIRRVLDPDRKLLEENYRDETGNLVEDENGIAIIRYGYDENGNKISEQYYNAVVEPFCPEKKGYASAVFEYDAEGNQISQAYYDETGKRVLAASGYEKTVLEYD